MVADVLEEWVDVADVDGLFLQDPLDFDRADVF